MTLWACLVLLLLLASPDGAEAAKKKKKKKKKSTTTSGIDARTGTDSVDDDDASLFREPLPETREDALVFHSESVPESGWSWRATKRRAREAWDGMSGLWDGISASANDVAEKLHLPSKREREMVVYYAKLIGSRIKAQWDAVDWDQLSEEIPEIKGFRKTWSEFQNVTGFTSGWKSALASPFVLMWTGCKWAMALLW